MGILETSLEVVKLATAVANPQLIQAATRANIEALELSTKNLELHKKVLQLEEQVKELNANLILTGEVFREGDHVFRDGEPTSYCSRCWDAEHKLIHIIFMDMGQGRGYKPGCPQCKTATHGRGQNPRMKQGV
jgi:hypothetical protein